MSSDSGTQQTTFRSSHVLIDVGSRWNRFWPSRAPNLPKIFLAIAGIVALVATSVVAMEPRPALSQGVALVKVDVSIVAKGYRVSKLIGTTVINDKNEKIGTIDDIVIDHTRDIYGALQVGGFLGIGGRLIVIPYNSLIISEDGRKIPLPGATQESLKNLSEFKYQM
jgi:sporulation protein YlmC with PRC-barrel domain